MAQRKPGCGCLPILGLSALVITTGSFAYLHRFPQAGITPVEATKIVPQTAFGSAFIETNPQTWAKLEKFGTPEAHQVIKEGLEEMKAGLSHQGISYERDIQPWIGGIVIAFLPSTTSLPTEALLIVGIKNPIAALDFQRKLEQNGEITAQESQYKGMTIKTITTKDGQAFNSAVIGNKLILASQMAAIEQVIDTHKGEPSYQDRPEVKQLLSQSLTVKSPLIQFLGDNYGQLLQQGGLPPEAEIPEVEKIKGMIAAIGVAEQGLHLQAVVRFEPVARTPHQGVAGDIFQQLPADSIAVLSGENLKEAWTGFVAFSQANPELEAIVAQIRQNLSLGGLNADREVFGWMDGEFALGIVPSGQGVGGLAIWETSDFKTADLTLGKITRAARFFPFSMDRRNVSNLNITEWKTPDQKVAFSYGWLNQDSLMLTVGMPFAAVNNKTSLAQSPIFQEAIQPLPKDNFGYFYVNIEQLMGEMVNVFPAEIRQNITAEKNYAILSSLKALALTSSQPDAQTGQLDVILSLKKNN